MLDTLWNNAKKMNEALPGSFKIEASLKLSQAFFGELVAPKRVHYAAATHPVTPLFWHFKDRKIENQADGTIVDLDASWGTDLDDTPPEIWNHSVIIHRFKYGKEDAPETPKALLENWNFRIEHHLKTTPDSMDIVVLWYMPWLIGDKLSPLFTRAAMVMIDNTHRKFLDVLLTGV